VSLTLVFLLVQFNLLAQLYDVTRYADHNGLSSRIVRDVIQDQHGFLWIAGNNGLYKFDGKHFTPFFSALNDTSGLRANKIQTLIEASDGAVWVATTNGLHVVANDTVRYVPFQEDSSDAHSITALFEDTQGSIWIGTHNGLYRRQLLGDHIIQMDTMPDEVVGDQPVWNISEDLLGRIWISTPKGPYTLTLSKNTAFKKPRLRFHDGIQPVDINLFDVIQFSENLFLAESSIGLLAMREDEAGTLHFNRFKEQTGAEPLPTFFIYKSIVAKDKSIWCATWRNNILRFRLRNDTLVHEPIKSSTGMQEMFAHSISVYEDRQSNMWVANANGLFKFSESTAPFLSFPQTSGSDQFGTTMNVNTILTDDHGFLWMSSNNGLYRLRSEDLLSFNTLEDVVHLENSNFEAIQRVQIDDQDRLWILSLQGLAVTQLDKERKPQDFVYYNTKDGLEHDWCYDLVQEDQNTFWISTYTGLVKMELIDGDLAKPQFTVNLDPTKKNLIELWTPDLAWDKDSSLWVASNGGISEVRLQDDPVVINEYSSSFGDTSSISNNLIKKIYCDHDGRIWVGTQKGLNLFNPADGTFTQFGRSSGLPSEYILGIQQNPTGTFWIATTNGILSAKYDAVQRTFTNQKRFTLEDGLTDNITNRDALLIDDHDQVFIGNSQGLNFYVPGNKKEAVASQIAVTVFQSIDGDDQFHDLRQSLNDGAPISLSYAHNSILLDYALLDFSDPEKNEYRHRLLPQRNSWIYAQNNAKLSYYNLAPGTYELVLDARAFNGSWSSAPIKLHFEIAPPFWRSTWAYLFYGLCLLGATRLGFAWQLKKQVKVVERKAQFERALIAEREKLRQDNAADFHDELGSMVSKISIFLSLAETRYKEQKDPSEFFQKIRANITGLSSGFRDLLWVIDPSKDNLNDTFLHIKDLGEDLFDNTGVDLRTSIVQDQQSTFQLNPQTKKQLVLIFKEVMTNCAKHAQCNRAELQLRVNNGSSSLFFSDNGKGINTNEPSQGRGLNNMRTRAEKSGMTLHIESSEKGTKVTVSNIPPA